MKDMGLLEDGTTATTCLLRREGPNTVLYTANVGDSHAVLVRSGTALQLSTTHRPSNPLEAQRVRAAGAHIKQFGSGDSRICAGGYQLQLTRSLGDHLFKQLAPSVLGECDVSTTTLTQQDSFLILASDGVWDFVPPAEAAAMCAAQSVQHTADALMELAISRGSSDNICVLVIAL
eukprot:gnl/Spiro4/18292_TR9779_c0_g1_i1.p2 gnl/Spiro4/18292_TR9779_c0_g1~~gnl/Spiro4/18292_TR9779_c0_g1_i1.p2  ORF type:complete len:176 (-),score=64.60 gnl/Spiro4/18292_TR9779_c0_g1_i1:70-597(-)